MSRGTILISGPSDREIELLSLRLEQENYSVLLVKDLKQASASLREGTVQAIFFSPLVHKSLAKRVIQAKNSSQRTRHIPVIQLAHDLVPPPLAYIKGVGESFRLHAIPMQEAVERLKRAIALCQLVRL